MLDNEQLVLLRIQLLGTFLPLPLFNANQLYLCYTFHDKKHL